MKKKHKKNGKLAAAAVKLDITVEVERLAAMEPELAELEMKSVAGQLGIPVDRLRKFVDRRRQKLLLEEHKKAAREPGEHQAKKKSQADLLVDLAADGVELFHDGDKAFASVKLDGHVETWPARSTRFRLHLRRLFHATHQKAPGAQAVEDAVNTLCGKALFDGPEQSVYLRVAGYNGGIYLDLCDERWRAVGITRDGWSVVDSPPVKFRRARGMFALPEPVLGGSIEDLRVHLNLEDDAQFRLAVGWVIAALAGRGPFPILVLHGEQGSGKTTFARFLRSLVDPSASPVRAEPREVRDLMIAGGNAHVIALDNLSNIPPWISDALCRLSTGGGFSTRELYTDDEEVIFDARKPIILTGIEELATRADLLDRAIILYLPTIAEKKRMDEKALERAFENVRPRILGALCDAISSALDRVEKVKLDRLPRMADFAMFVTAAEPGLGWAPGTFMLAYAENRNAANTLALEASIVAAEIQKLDWNQSWQGTAGELLKLLAAKADDDTKRARAWPGSARVLSNALRRVSANLREVGIEVTFMPKSHGGKRPIDIRRAEKGFPCDSSPPPPPPDFNGGAGGASVHGNPNEDEKGADGSSGPLLDGVLADCAEMDTTLKVQDGTLAIVGAPPSALVARIKQNEDAIVAYLWNTGGVFPVKDSK